MTKSELVEEIAQSTGIDKAIAMRVVESFMRQSTKAFKAGKSIYLRGFGTFELKTRKEKKARNITKGTMMVLPAHKVVAFKVAATTRAAVKKLPVTKNN